MREGARGIQSIEVGGRILLALVEACAPMMLKDLASAAGITPAQCHAYLSSLRAVGLVHQDPQSGYYQTGPFALRLGIGWLRSTDLFTRAMAKLAVVSEDFDAISAIAVWGPNGPTIVHVNRASFAAATNIRQGTLFSVTGTATGRVFAAFDHRKEVALQIELEMRSPNDRPSIADSASQAEFASMVDATRKAGYATIEGRPLPNVNAISVPLFDSSGALALVGTLLGTGEMVSVQDDSDAVRRMKEISLVISENSAPERREVARA